MEVNNCDHADLRIRHHDIDIPPKQPSPARSQRIPKRHRPITQHAQFLWRVPIVLAACHLLVALLVNALVVEVQHEPSNDASTDEAELERVTEMIVWFIHGAVEVGCHCYERMIY
jgi:hypothetical protein